MRDFGDLYHLTAEQLENLVVTPKEPRSERAVPRKLGKVGRNVIEQIERSRQNDLSRLVYGLGIRHVGEKAAATLARHMRTMHGDPRRAGRGAADDPGDRSGARGVGPRVRRRAAQPRARSRSWRRPASTWRASSRRPDVSAPGPLAGKTFVLTGTLPTMTREEATKAIEELGGKVVGLGQQEDQLRGRRRRGRHQAGEGATARHTDPRRSRVPRDNQACRAEAGSRKLLNWN